LGSLASLMREALEPDAVVAQESWNRACSVESVLAHFADWRFDWRERAEQSFTA